MKALLTLEECGMLLLAIAGLYGYHAPWWAYVLLLFGPDISMLGYLAGNKTGAAVYNFFHHRTVAILFYLAGILLANQVLLLTGVILFGHAALDRALGYGLKLKQGFKYTHLGIIGKNNNERR
ncbi:DUF4260 domain-containing protein [Niabella beijingensis]|uniref:DUF4260 domain-containing protein n=1 Tax=Niabella beijingensis TaxID=2872700 RepID=UPI001CBE391E|nr:DUF4260 domain-containing protein [Niabella beijingensis]MBZ4192220.1 DUF4260 domain-containing protein [Niabella beijingensis]